MQRMRRFISEQRVDLRLTVEITAGKVAEISQALNKNEQARLWAYFAKWKCCHGARRIDTSGASSVAI